MTELRKFRLMKGSILLVALLPVMAGIAQPERGSDHELLVWNPYYQLQWYDFQGSRPADAKGDAGASVRIKAKPFMVGKSIRYDVVALFDRSKSWAVDRSESLLAHEQLHFDIAELYARKIRKRIMELRKEGVNDLKTYNREIEALLAESNDADRQYDLETLHGALSRKQESWSARVKEQLRSLDDFRKARRIIK